MKKFLLFSMLLLLLFALLSCGTETCLGPDQTDESDITINPDIFDNPGSKPLDETKGGGEAPDHP